MNCILTTVSFSLPFNIVEMSQFELGNESVLVDEIQLYGEDGVHKSPEFSPLEFPQIEIRYSHCLAFKFQVSSICHHTRPVCDFLAGGYHSVRAVRVPGAYLIGFS